MAMKNPLEKSDYGNTKLFARLNKFRGYYITKFWIVQWKATPAVYEAINKWRDEGHDSIVKQERERYGKLQDR